jgi:putative ABC transport system permease protein
LLKSRGFAVVAALTLAAGIGANSAIFSIIDAVLLRSLPFHQPERLVRLYETEAAPGKYPFSGPDFVDWKARNTTFSDMTLFFWPTDMNLSGKGQVDHVRGVPVEANFFSLLGVNPMLGRTWAAGEDQPGKNDVVILGYDLWQSRFAGDAKAIGQSLELNARPYTIIGVMPPGFSFPWRAQLWTPQDMSGRSLGDRGSHSFNAIGRLKHGVTVQKAQADVALIAAQLEEAFPDSHHKVGAVVVPLQEDLIGKSRDSLVIMFSAVGLVLLIACANMANLLLSRALGRQKEMAIRSALGASRFRLLRQLLTESLMLSLVGGGMGLLAGWGLVALLPRIQSFSLPDFNVVQVNGSVLAFTFGLAVVTGVLFGVFPAFQTSRPDLHDELKGGAGSSVTPGARRRIASNVLVAGEIALSLLLLICAGLLLKDFARIRSIDVGVRPQGVWTGALQLPEATYKAGQQQAAFSQRLLEQARQIPGVETASLSNRLPLEGGSNYYVQVRGRLTERFSGPLVETHRVSPDYFRAMGIPLLRGRVFTPQDVQKGTDLDVRRRQAGETNTALPAAETNQMVYPCVINEAMTRYFWPNEDPVGQMFAGGGGGPNGPWRQVIGVVGDVRQWGLTQKPRPEAYDPLYGSPRVFLVLHTSVAPVSVTSAVRRAVARINSSLPLFRVRTMEEVVADNSQGQRFLSALVGAFAGLAALLAAIGIYGVLSYAVAQRTREIGIRMSLGASRARVLGEVVREGMVLALAGFALGIAGALAAGRVLQSQLHEVEPRDPAVFTGTAALLALATLLACYIPARRASRLDPMRALREE